MVSEIPLGLRAFIDTLVHRIARRKRPDPPARHEFVVYDPEDRICNFGVNELISAEQCIEHVRTHFHVLAFIVHIVGQVTGLRIPEQRLEIILHQLFDPRPVLDELAVLRTVCLLHPESEADHLVPEYIRFNLVSGPFGHRIAVDVCIHP